jgi:uncharacterized protein
VSALLDEQDLRDLDELLALIENADALHLDGTQGLLTACIIGPEPVPAAEWLPLVLGGETGLPSEAEARLIELLMKLHDAIRQGLWSYAYEPIFAEHEDEDGERVSEVGGWCEGFSLGVDLRAEAWERALSAEPELMDLLEPVMALGVDDGVFAQIRDPDLGNLSEAEREQLMLQLPGSMAELLHHFSGQRGGPVSRTLH